MKTTKQQNIRLYDMIGTLQGIISTNIYGYDVPAERSYINTIMQDATRLRSEVLKELNS
jgi:hypothetical protein